MNTNTPNKNGVPLLLAGAALSVVGTIMGFQGMQHAEACGSFTLQIAYSLLTSVVAGAGGFSLIATYKALAKPAPTAVAG